jgi:hypothetical protein
MSGNTYDQILQGYLMYQQYGIDTNTAAQYYQAAQAQSAAAAATSDQSGDSGTIFCYNSFSP